MVARPVQIPTFEIQGGKEYRHGAWVQQDLPSHDEDFDGRTESNSTAIGYIHAGMAAISH